MTAEILSIIAVCISGITAICSACVPAILSYKAKLTEIRINKEIEAQKEDEANFELFYRQHIDILNELSIRYMDWKVNKQEKFALLCFLDKMVHEFKHSCDSVHELYNRVNNYQDGDDLDLLYNQCLDEILNYYGVRVYANTPNVLTSDMLKIILRKKFNDLKTSTGEKFGASSPFYK